MSLDNDTIWRALANPQRRALLKALRGGPQTTTHLVEQLPAMTRFAVMKHISVLRDAGLVLTRDDGPRKMNSLNAVPLRLVYEELVDDYQDLWAQKLLNVKRRAESEVTREAGAQLPPEPKDAPKTESHKVKEKKGSE